MTHVYTPPSAKMKQKRSAGLAGQVCAIVLLGSALFLILAGVWETYRGPFFGATAMLSVYLFFEVWLFLQKGASGSLLAPPFLATFLYFYLSHVMPAMARFSFPQIDDRWLSIDPMYWDTMPEQVLLTMLGAFCMWRGYYWSGGLSKTIAVEVKRATLIRKELNPSVVLAISGQAIFALTSLYSAGVGLLGIMGTAETRAARIEIYQLLAFGVGLGTISFMLLIVAYFRKRQKREAAPGLLLICLISLALQLIVGLMSGFKQQLVIPFAVGGFAYFMVYQRAPWMMIAGGAVAIVAAYAVVEPYRAYVGREDMRGSAGAADMIYAIQEGHRLRGELLTSEKSTLQQVVERFDLNGIASLGISYTKEGLVAEAEKEWMTEGLIMAPINAVIPRALWPEKPSYSTGGWFNRNVLLKWDDEVTSVGMGPVTYLHIVGGALGVGLGFLLIGVLQGAVFRGLALTSAGGMLVYVAGANFLVILPSDVGAGFAGFIQLSILALLGQFVLLRPDYKPKRVAAS